MEVDLVIGADGANSKVAKAIDAGEYDYAIAFQERMTIPDDKMKYYEVLSILKYVGVKCTQAQIFTGNLKIAHKKYQQQIQRAITYVESHASKFQEIYQLNWSLILIMICFCPWYW